MFAVQNLKHNKNNETSIIPNPQIEQGDKQDCVIEDGVFHDNLFYRPEFENYINDH
jgi:hypothetical protein